jgi:hypothetical protein
MLAFRHFLFGFEYSLSAIFEFLCEIGSLLAFLTCYGTPVDPKVTHGEDT